MKLKDLQAMSEGEQRMELAELLGYTPHSNRHQHALWFRPNEAHRLLERTTGLPVWHGDLNAIEAAEHRMGIHDQDNTALRVKWANHLHVIIAPRCPVNKAGHALVSDIHKMLASASERTQALILTLSQA